MRLGFFGTLFAQPSSPAYFGFPDGESVPLAVPNLRVSTGSPDDAAQLDDPEYAGLPSYLLILFSALSAFAVVG